MMVNFFLLFISSTFSNNTFSVEDTCCRAVIYVGVRENTGAISNSVLMLSITIILFKFVSSLFEMENKRYHFFNKRWDRTMDPIETKKTYHVLHIILLSPLTILSAPLQPPTTFPQSCQDEAPKT